MAVHHSLCVLLSILLLYLRGYEGQVVDVQWITLNSTDLSSNATGETICIGALKVNFFTNTELFIGLCGNHSGAIGVLQINDLGADVAVMVGDLASPLSSSVTSWDGMGLLAKTKVPAHFHQTENLLRFIDDSSCGRRLNLTSWEITTLFGACGNVTAGSMITGMTYVEMSTTWFLSIDAKRLYAWDEALGSSDPSLIQAELSGVSIFSLASNFQMGSTSQYIWQKMGKGIRRYDYSAFSSPVGNLSKGSDFVTYFSPPDVDTMALYLEYTSGTLGAGTADISVSPDGRVLVIGDHEMDKLYFLDIETYNETSKDIEMIQELCSSTSASCSLSSATAVTWLDNTTVLAYDETNKMFATISAEMITAVPSVNLSYDSAGYPEFYRNEAIKFNCSATGYIALTRLYLIYETTSQTYRMGCYDSGSGWLAVQDDISALGIDVMPIQESVCQAIGTNQGFTLEVSTRITNTSVAGSFYCRTEQWSKQVSSTQVDITTVKERKVVTITSQIDFYLNSAIHFLCESEYFTNISSLELRYRPDNVSAPSGNTGCRRESDGSWKTLTMSAISDVAYLTHPQVTPDQCEMMAAAGTEQGFVFDLDVSITGSIFTGEFYCVGTDYDMMEVNSDEVVVSRVRDPQLMLTDDLLFTNTIYTGHDANINCSATDFAYLNSILLILEDGSGVNASVGCTQGSAVSNGDPDMFGVSELSDAMCSTYSSSADWSGLPFTVTATKALKSGQLFCTATESVVNLEVESPKRYVNDLRVAPTSLLLTLTPTTVRKGESFTFTCTSTGGDPASIFTYKLKFNNGTEETGNAFTISDVSQVTIECTDQVHDSYLSPSSDTYKSMVVNFLDPTTIPSTMPSSAGSSTPLMSTPTAMVTLTPATNIPSTTVTPAPATNIPSTTVTPTPATNIPSTTVTPAPATNIPTTTVTPAPTTNIPTTTVSPAPATNIPTTMVTPAPATNIPTTTVTPAPVTNSPITTMTSAPITSESASTVVPKSDATSPGATASSAPSMSSPKETAVPTPSTNVSVATKDSAQNNSLPEATVTSVASSQPASTGSTTQKTTLPPTDPKVSQHMNTSTFPDLYSGEKLNITCHAHGFRSIQELTFVYQSNTSSYHVGCMTGERVSSADAYLKDPTDSVCLPTMQSLAEFQFTVTLTLSSDMNGAQVFCNATDIDPSKPDSTVSNVTIITQVQMPPQPISMSIEPLPIMKGKLFTFRCNSSTTGHMNYTYVVKRGDMVLVKDTMYTPAEVDKYGITLECSNPHHPNWIGENTKLARNISYHSDAEIQIEYKSNGEPDFYLHDMTDVSCIAHNFTWLTRIRLNFFGLSGNFSTWCMYDHQTRKWKNGYNIDAMTSGIFVFMAITTPEMCEHMVGGNGMQMITVPVNNTMGIENGTFQCLAYESFTGNHYMAGLNVTELKEQPTKQDVNMTIDPWPIVEGSPFTVSCVSSSRSVNYGYEIKSRDGQVLSNTSSYTPTSSDVSGIRVNCFDTVHPNWRPQGRGLIISSDFDGVAHISHKTSTFPDIYVRQPNLITCMATNFTYLSEITLVYYNKTSNSQSFKIGCELDEAGNWMFKTSGNVTHSIRIQPFECPAAMTGSSLVNLQFNVTLMSHMVNGYFYCHTVDSGNGEERTTTNVTVDTVKVPPENITLIVDPPEVKIKVKANERFNFTCHSSPPEANSVFIYRVSKGANTLSNTNFYTPTVEDLDELTLMCTDSTHPKWKKGNSETLVLSSEELPLNTTASTTSQSQSSTLSTSRSPATTRATFSQSSTEQSTVTTRPGIILVTQPPTTSSNQNATTQQRATQSATTQQRATQSRTLRPRTDDESNQPNLTNQGKKTAGKTTSAIRVGSITAFVVSTLLLVASVTIFVKLWYRRPAAKIDPNISFKFDKGAKP